MTLSLQSGTFVPARPILSSGLATDLKALALFVLICIAKFFELFADIPAVAATLLVEGVM